MKAYSRGAKRRNRRGRPPLPAEDREPNGRLSRRAESRDEQQKESEMDAMHTVVEARIRHHGIVDGRDEKGKMRTAEQWASDPEYGSVLGVMYMRGAITWRQHEGGKRYAEDMAWYHGLCGYTFLSARAQNLFAVRGRGGDGPDRTEEAKAARQQAAKLQDAVLLGKNFKTGKYAYDIGTGRKVEHVVKLICLLDDRETTITPYMVSLLKRGLNSLAKFYLGDS